MQKILLSLTAIVLSSVLLVGCARTASVPETPTPTTTPVEELNDSESMLLETDDLADTELDSREVKEFVVEGSEMKFVPNSMTVNKGDTVRITFKNVEGFHDFVIDEFDVQTKQIQAGAEEVVEFVADQAGTFDYYCSVGEHRSLGMEGSLIVEEIEI